MSTNLNPNVAAILRMVEATSVARMVRLTPEEREQLLAVNELIAPRPEDQSPEEAKQ